MKKIIVALLLLPFLSVGQTTQLAGGMKFEHGLSWKEIQAKAKAENKYIIMDCFTTWCGPCTYMTNNIFPLPEVGAFFNDKYLAVKVQFDTTKNEKGEIKDNDEVKAWFKDMEAINAQYKIRAYPTYLIFDPNGVAVHRAVGSSDAATFIAKGKDGMVPEKQYYTQLRKYENGEKEPAFLKSLALIAQGAYDLDNANKVGKEYIASQTDLYNKETLTFIDKFTSTSKDKGFTMMLENPEKVDAVLGKGKSEQKVKAIIYQENVVPALRVALRKDATAPLDFVALHEKLSKAYPTYAAELSSKAKVLYYQSKKDWNNFQTEIVSFMNVYGDKANVNELNSYAWTVFENCKDMSCVTQALEWSKRSFAENQNPGFMDTYANILHKLGRTKEAIEVQEKAIALVDGDTKKTYQETLDKMKKGEKTWTEK